MATRIETLSVTQANQLIGEVNKHLVTCQEKMTNSFNTFLDDLSRLWEDQNAVDFAKKINDIYQELLNEMTIKNGFFGTYVINLANLYIRIGNMNEKVTEEPKTFSGEINYQVVKKYFANSENEDDFGFKDPTNAGIQEILQTYKTLYRSLQDITLQLSKDILKTNAFGNTSVMGRITTLSAELIRYMMTELTEIERHFSNSLRYTFEEYSKIATSVINEG